MDLRDVLRDVIISINSSLLFVASGDSVDMVEKVSNKVSWA